jgi:hypothetical protein
VQQYLVENASAVGEANASDARRQLDTAIVAIDAAAAEQGTITREVRGEVHRRASLERLLVRKFMTPLSVFARAQLKGVPEYAALTPSTTSLERERLVQAAHAMANAADKHAAELAKAKFPVGFLAQLRAAADAVQSSFNAGGDKRVKKTGVTEKIAVAVREGRRAVGALDAVVRHVILGNEALEREWRSAKRVRQSHPAPAAAAAGTVAESIVPQEAPKPAQEVKPAAV